MDGAAVAMDVGTLPFDPRVEVRPDEAPEQASANAGADMGLL